MKNDLLNISNFQDLKILKFQKIMINSYRKISDMAPIFAKRRKIFLRLRRACLLRRDGGRCPPLYLIFSTKRRAWSLWFECTYLEHQKRKTHEVRRVGKFLKILKNLLIKTQRKLFHTNKLYKK